MATLANLTSRLRSVSGTIAVSDNSSEKVFTDTELEQVLTDALGQFDPSKTFTGLEAKEEFPVILLAWANTHLIRAGHYARFFPVESPDGGGDKSDPEDNHLKMFDKLMERYKMIAEELGVGLGGGEAITVGTFTRRSPLTDLVVPTEVAKAPDAVELLSLTANGSGVVDVVWDESDDPNFLMYRVYRHTSAGLVDLTRLTASSSKYRGIIDAATEVTVIHHRWTTSYRDSGLTAGTTYYYVVQSVDMNSRVAHSNESSVAAT